MTPAQGEIGSAVIRDMTPVSSRVYTLNSRDCKGKPGVIHSPTSYQWMPLPAALLGVSMPVVFQSLPTESVSSQSHSPTAFARHLPPHPTGFYFVCLAVFGERWAAYTLASSVVLLLCERYGYARPDALRLAGILSAASYLGAMPGGFTSDRLLGHRRALGASLLLLAVGYAALTQPSLVALWFALGLLILGNGLFKPSIHALLSQLYGPDDPRLDASQVWFHLVINLGAAFGAIATGLATLVWGRSAPFFIAAVVVLIGRIGLSIGHLHFRPRLPFEHNGTTGTSQALKPSTTQQIKTVGALTLAMLLFNICYGQVEGSLLLWTGQHVERTLLGFTVPPSWFVGLPALLVLVIAPAQLALLPGLQRRFGVFRLVAVGLLATSLAFLVLFPAVVWSKTQLVSMGWLVACHTLLVIGETLVGPLGLAQVLRLAPPRFVGAVMGLSLIHI